MKMLLSKLRELCGVMSLRSKVLSDYFNTLMKNHNIKSNRNGMKVLIFYCFSEVISSHMSERGVLFRPIVALCAFCVFFLIYALTVNVQDNSVMMKMSSIMVLMSLSYTILIATDLSEIMETNYSLTIIIIILIYNLFRLKFLVTMLLSMVYIIIFIAIANYRLNFIELINSTRFEIRPLKSVRFIDVKMEHKHNFIFGQTILLFLIYLTGMYLRFFNSIRRKSAFLKLAQTAEAKMKMNSAIKVQTYWIEAIMPSSVKDKFLKQIGSKDMFNLVYCQPFDNVSILFADIVGFTAMSSNKSAAQLVFLLNDLYNRFDEYGKLSNCEKIGTLGDCYYCVSGCPVARADHAVCCIEMGLGMCRLIQKFNKDHMENVNMRVGVHSGRVMAAIIGNHRFRFDVFSNDVIVANALESSGKPGLVHISENTCLLIRQVYLVKDGENLEIKKEENYGLSGMTQRVTTIKTYFVIPNIIQRRRTHDTNINNAINNSSKVRINTERKSSYSMKANQEFQKNDKKIKEDLQLIRILQRDPARPVEFFQNPPVNPFILSFKDREIEEHYLFHCMDQQKDIKLDSIKIAPLFDSIACMFYSSITLLATYIMIPKSAGFTTITYILYVIGIFVTLIIAWSSLIFKSEINIFLLRKVFYILSHPISRLILCLYISSLPNLLILSLVESQDQESDYQYISSYFTLTLFTLVCHCIFTTSCSFIKNVSTITFTIIGIINFIYLFKNHTADKNMMRSCTYYLINHINIQNQRYEYNFSFQLIHICLLIYYLTRENEKNTRIYFYASREAEIRNDEAKREKRIAEGLLYNIIPKYVFVQIMSNRVNRQKNMRFSYAHAIPNAGVLFACISNFFSVYYREDYKGGEVALKLLHTIICTFDNILQKPLYRQVEKIKTINDCYMVASGLNTNSELAVSERHLRTLMNFAFDIQSNLCTFNQQNIIGNDPFQMKIGFNFGPVTAGIIGNSKPLYDIWGDTVNVASRMYSTAPSGFIQVPDYVEKKLGKYFEFEFRGNVSIKGKGEMMTYLAISSKDVIPSLSNSKFNTALF